MKRVWFILWIAIFFVATPALAEVYRVEKGDTWESIFTNLKFIDRSTTLNDLKSMNEDIGNRELRAGEEIVYLSQNEYWRALAKVDRKMESIPKGSPAWLKLLRDERMMKNGSIDFSAKGNQKERGVYWIRILEYANQGLYQ